MDKRYGAIDGLRTIAAIGIVLMHIRSNTTYAISGYIYDTIVPSFTDFTFLFMTISAFGMCCGYYEKILNNKISIPEFYIKRFAKTLPFFAVLAVIDIIISPSLNSIYEGFADLTLLFGFLPNGGNISVIGVGWFLGLIFVFYICFPFFCVLLENKRRAWMALAISLIYNFVCSQYFDVGRRNILYSSCFFLVGGLIYLYRHEISKLNKWLGLAIAAGIIILYYVIGENTITRILVSASLLIYATLVSSGSVLENRLTKFMGSISLEVYLSHMFVFRVIEKLRLHNLLGNGWVQYFATVVMVMAGAIAYALAFRSIFGVIKKKFQRDQLIQ